MELLKDLTERQQTSSSSEWRNALLAIAKAIVSGLQDIGKPVGRDSFGEWGAVRENIEVGRETVVNLLSALIALGDRTLNQEAAREIAARPGRFDPIVAITPALDALLKSGKGSFEDEGLLDLWKYAAGFALDRSEIPPDPPKDWRQSVKISCDCVDCRELQLFVFDPVNQMHRFRVREDRRGHLHEIIQRHTLDMTHATERTGSPRTLVCTKNRRSFLQRREQYQKDVAAMRSLVEMSAKMRGTDKALEKKLKLAIERAVMSDLL